MRASAKIIRLHPDYPKLDAGEESARPYRLWDANEKTLVRWRWYLHPYKAHVGALLEAGWAKPGACFEVIDIRTASLLAQYKRTPTGIQITAIKRGYDGPTQ